MRALLIIIVVMVVIGILGAIFEFIKKHPVGIITAILILVTAFVYWPVAVGIAVVWILYMLIFEQSKMNNKTKLLQYLNNNCLMRGCQANADLSFLAPEFVSKNYKDETYTEIVTNWLRSVENHYITNDKQLNWLRPAINYLEYNKMADVYELERIASNGLRVSHLTPDGKLICDAMKGLCATYIVNGQHKYQMVPMEAEAIRKEMNIVSGNGVPQYYLFAFRVNDFSQNMGPVSMGNIESEEVSAEDLGIDM